MKSYEIYETAKKKAFNKIMHQRDSHAPQPIETDTDTLDPIRSVVLEIKDDKAKEYSWVIKEAEKYSNEMLKEILSELLKKYDIAFQTVEYDRRKVQPEPIFAFVTESDKTLYVIQSLHGGQLQRDALASFYLAYGAKKLRIIIAVYENAYKLRFNHNDDERDPSRGTGLYSIAFLFETLFGTEEYECFKAFEQKYVEEVRAYLGYQIVKTLTPNALFSFKKTVEYSLVSFPYRKYITEMDSDNISETVLGFIEDQFITKKYYKALIGKSDFAQSFITAEWLYDSMKSADKIDFTAVVMGYFKSVEQLMYEIVKGHTGEGRTIKRKASSSFGDLTQDNLNAGVLDTTLGALIGFLKYYPNRDLFLNVIRNNQDAQKGILSIIELAKEDRNGYFHKDNIKEWSKIEEARVLSFSIMFLLLGAYEFSEKDRIELNIPDDTVDNDFYRLCEFINYNSDQLFYICEDGKEVIPAFAVADAYISIDEYGDPKYSGVYFKRVFGVGPEQTIIDAVEAVKKNTISTGDVIKYEEDSLPIRIYSGVMAPCKAGMLFSGPQHLIYENGQYAIPKQLVPMQY